MIYLRAYDGAKADAVGEDSFDVQRAVGLPVLFEFLQSLALLVEDRRDVRVSQVGQPEI